MKFQHHLIFIFVNILLAFFSADAQTFKKFTLKGAINGGEDGQVEISDRYGNDPNLKVDHKKVNLINGRFEFTGKMAYPFSVYLTYYANGNKSFTREFYINAGNQIFKADTGSLASDHQLSGSAINTEYLNKYLPIFTDVDKKLNDWYGDYDKYAERLKRDTALLLEDSLQNVRHKLANSKDSIFYTYARNNKNSFLVLWELDHLLERKYTGYYNQAYKALNKSIQTSRLGDSVLKAISSLKKTLVGARLANMILLDTNFNNKNLAFAPTNKSSYLFVDLWYSNCAPCIAQFPELISARSRYGGKGFQMMSISVIEKQGRAGWLRAIHQHKLSWPQYFDPHHKFMYQLRVLNFPSNLLIDKRGVIIAKNLTPAQLENYLNKHLNYN